MKFVLTQFKDDFSLYSPTHHIFGACRILDSMASNIENFQKWRFKITPRTILLVHEIKLGCIDNIDFPSHGCHEGAELENVLINKKKSN